MAIPSARRCNARARNLAEHSDTALRKKVRQSMKAARREDTSKRKAPPVENA